MKTHPKAALRRSPQNHGFTLMELLIVMVIIGILASLTVAGFRWAQDSASRNRTKMAHETIKNGLEQYKEANGEYPAPANRDESDTFAGSSFRTGGAHMLYQALTGDGTNAIHLDVPPASGLSESDGEVTEAEKDNVLNSSSLPKSVYFPPNLPVGTSRARYLVDGWNRPFQYTKAETGPANMAVNPTYDLWSFGSATGNSSVGDSPEMKRNSELTAPWIKNW
jgi:prepilin-type N-terminal cleavage/methylation domain-containing protein